MDDATISMLMGPYGVTVGALVVAAGAIRASIFLYRELTTERRGRLEDQQKYLDVVESQKNYHIEAQKVLTKNIVVMEMVREYLQKGRGGE